MPAIVMVIVVVVVAAAVARKLGFIWRTRWDTGERRVRLAKRRVRYLVI